MDVQILAMPEGGWRKLSPRVPVQPFGERLLFVAVAVPYATQVRGDEGKRSQCRLLMHTYRLVIVDEIDTGNNDVTVRRMHPAWVFTMLNTKNTTDTKVSEWLGVGPGFWVFGYRCLLTSSGSQAATVRVVGPTVQLNASPMVSFTANCRNDRTTSKGPTSNRPA